MTRRAPASSRGSGVPVEGEQPRVQPPDRPHPGGRGDQRWEQVELGERRRGPRRGAGQQPEHRDDGDGRPGTAPCREPGEHRDTDEHHGDPERAARACRQCRTSRSRTRRAAAGRAGRRLPRRRAAATRRGRPATSAAATVPATPTGRRRASRASTPSAAAVGPARDPLSGAASSVGGHPDLGPGRERAGERRGDATAAPRPSRSRARGRRCRSPGPGRRTRRAGPDRCRRRPPARSPPARRRCGRRRPRPSRTRGTRRACRRSPAPSAGPAARARCRLLGHAVLPLRAAIDGLRPTSQTGPLPLPSAVTPRRRTAYSRARPV